MVPIAAGEAQSGCLDFPVAASRQPWLAPVALLLLSIIYQDKVLYSLL